MAAVGRKKAAGGTAEFCNLGTTFPAGVPPTCSACSCPVPHAWRRALAAVLLASVQAAAQTLTPGGPANTFQFTTYVGGQGQLTDFRFLPDGRVVMTEKTGAVKVRRTDGSVVTAGIFDVDSAYRDRIARRRGLDS